MRVSAGPGSPSCRVGSVRNQGWQGWPSRAEAPSRASPRAGSTSPVCFASRSIASTSGAPAPDRRPCVQVGRVAPRRAVPRDEQSPGSPRPQPGCMRRQVRGSHCGLGGARPRRALDGPAWKTQPFEAAKSHMWLSWRLGWMPTMSLVRNGPGWTPGSKRHPVAAVGPSPPRFGDAVRLSDPALVSVADRNCTVSAP